MLPLSSWKANIWYEPCDRRNLRKRPVPLYSGCWCLFSNYPRETRLQYVKRFYARFPHLKFRCRRQSCPACVPDSSVQLLRTDRVRRQPGFHHATSSAIVKYVSQRAGIGINAGVFVRWVARFAVAKRSIPAHSVLQTFPDCGEILLSGRRAGGAATLFYPMWHLEVESLLG